MTREVTRSITEYTRTVEYSQSMLSSRSDRWINKAREQAASGDLKKARKSLERALEIEPGNATAISELAELDRKLKSSSEDSG
jgi:Tfp pilus assembly protein PilF